MRARFCASTRWGPRSGTPSTGRARWRRSSPTSAAPSRSATGQPEGMRTGSSSSSSAMSWLRNIQASLWSQPDMDRLSITTVQEKEFGHQLEAKLNGRNIPLSGQWELTCRCNLRCVMCYTDCFNTPDMLRQELSFREIIRIMDEIREAGCLELTFTGGEPLARRDFLDIYAHAKQEGFLVTVFTNGTLV